MGVNLAEDLEGLADLTSSGDTGEEGGLTTGPGDLVRSALDKGSGSVDREGFLGGGHAGGDDAGGEDDELGELHLCEYRLEEQG